MGVPKEAESEFVWMYAHWQCGNQRVAEIMHEHIVVFQVYVGVRVRFPCVLSEYISI